MSGKNAKIAYIHIQFPKLSETFVWREIEALEKLGLNLKNYSTARPFPDEVNDTNRKFIDKTIYLPKFASIAMLKSHLKWFFRRPLVYVRTLLQILSSRYPPGNWWLAWRKPLLFWRSVHLASMIDDDKDIVHLHAHFKYVATIEWIASRFTGHTYSFSSHFATNALMVGKVARDAEFVAAVSERELKIVEKEMQAGSDTPLHLTRLGLPDDYFGDIDEENKPPIPTIISVGRLIPKKGFIFLLRAFAELKSRGIDFRATIVGDGPMKEELESMAAKIELGKHVTFAGALEPKLVRDALDASHVFALFCTYGPDGDVDGLPVAMMEAMARGLPVVATRISSLPELVADGESGFLVPPGDVTAFADALQKLIEDSELRERMSEKAREKVKSEYTLERQAREMKELFATIIKQGGR